MTDDTTTTGRHHRDVDPRRRCGGWIASGRMFGVDFWCVYCGTKFNATHDSPEVHK
jgi:hypothetical protein